MKQPVFILLCLWFGIGFVRVIAHLTWFNPSLSYWFPKNGEIHSEIFDLFIIANTFAIIGCVFYGPIIDCIG